MPVTISGTSGLAGVNGSASTPAVQGEDTNTGVFFPAADAIAFAEGGVEVARFDASGNLLVGTTTAGSRLTVSEGTTANLLLRGSTAIDAAGRVIGDISFQEPEGTGDGTLAIEASIKGIRQGTDSFNSGGGLTFSTKSFAGSLAERARIDDSGNLLVGTTSWATGQNAFRVNGPGAGGGRVDISRNTTAAADQVYFANPNGVIGAITTNGTTTSYVSSSDYRLKENVQPMQDALAVIAQLNPVTYTWKVDGSDGQGFIAHELQAVVPDCVTGEKDAVDEDGNPKYQGVDTSFLVATLVKAVQELTARIAALEAAK
jgi:hypothetical protein